MKKSKPKFWKGQVVMVIQASFRGGNNYPVKLDHRTYVGTRDGAAWTDTLNNVEYEEEMRPLTVREIGPRPEKRGKRK